MRILKTNPVLTIFNSYLVDSPQPSSISYLYNFGSLLGLSLVVQIITGIFLAMHFAGTAELAFSSAEHERYNKVICDKGIKFPVFLINNTEGYIENNNCSLNKSVNELNIHKNISDENFYEWFRGLVDGEGCFIIIVGKNKSGYNFNFKFQIFLHKDDTPMLEIIKQKLKVGKVWTYSHFASYNVTGKELHLLFTIFDNISLNTTKYLNYIALKKAYIIWYTRSEKNTTKDLFNVYKKILDLKNSMNKKRTNFKQASNHKILITPYWLLGFVEGEGYFCLKKTKMSLNLEFGLGQTKSEYSVIEAVTKYLLKLPNVDTLIKKRHTTKFVKHVLDRKAKNIRSKPMTHIRVNDMHYIRYILVPFFDKLIWFSKKEKDYIDWKTILNYIIQGKHLTQEGQDIILFINSRMNTRRLSTNIPSILPENLEERIEKLKEAPSNYEIHSDGRIYIKSKGVYLRGRGNVKVEVFNEKDLLINTFNSIKECAIYFKVDIKKISRRLNNSKVLYFKGKKYIFKRKIPTI